MHRLLLTRNTISDYIRSVHNSGYLKFIIQMFTVEEGLSSEKDKNFIAVIKMENKDEFDIEVQKEYGSENIENDLCSEHNDSKNDMISYDVITNNESELSPVLVGEVEDEYDLIEYVEEMQSDEEIMAQYPISISYEYEQVVDEIEKNPVSSYSVEKNVRITWDFICPLCFS